MIAQVKAEPYWWEAAPRPDGDDIPLPARVDVVVIGAGFTGLSAALTLARAGRSVHVLEKDRPGEGASSRNGGIASGNLYTSFSGAIKRFGLEQAKTIFAEGREARADLARFITDEQIDCDWDPVGRFTGAMNVKHYDRQAREAELLNRHANYEDYMVTRAEQHTEVGSDLYHGGLVRPDIAGVHPGKLHLGMLARAEQAGATIHPRTPMRSFRRESDDFAVVTDRGTIRARHLIVATNGYTGGALPWLQRRIVPIPSQVISTEPLPTDTMDRLMPKRRMLGETRSLYHYYRPSPDGRAIIFGGRQGATTADHRIKRARLTRRLVEIFPDLEGVEISHTWSGYTGFTFDFMPKLVVHDGAHYAAGFCGSGVVWARWLGAKAAQDIIGNAPAQTVFRAADFKTRPLYRGRPWFLPLAMGWYHVNDWLGR
ncbi:MAG: FAD-binding oxidoreductase [Pseudomonadota bacterium]